MLVLLFSFFAQSPVEAESFQQSRQQMLDDFNRNQTAADPLIFRQIDESPEKEDQVLDHQFRFSAETLTETSAPKIKEKESIQIPRQREKPSYFNRLSRAIPCFKEFIANLYQARSKRDLEIASCAAGPCEEKNAAADFEEASVTITDLFYQCLDEEPEIQSAKK